MAEGKQRETVPADRIKACSGDKDCGQAGGICCEHVCVAITSSSSCGFAVTGVSPDHGWLTGGDWLTLTGAGFSSAMRVHIGPGRAPTRVIDDAHAVVQTPPGPAGSHDVRIVLGKLEAKLKDGFRYDSGELTPQWRLAKMARKRGRQPAAAVTQDGRLFISGGTTERDLFSSGRASTGAELFDVGAPGRMSLSFKDVANTMRVGRCWNSAVTLLTGQVLVVGSCCSWADPAECSAPPNNQAEVFDPASNSFLATREPMKVGRGAPTQAILLADGRVLVSSANDPSLELYDPQSGTFKLIPHKKLHAGGFLVRLHDGRVLLGGGGCFTPDHESPLHAVTSMVEEFNPETETLRPVGPLNEPRTHAIAVVLPDGRVLIAGGYSDCCGRFTDKIELFDPVTNTFSLSTAKLSSPRAGVAGVLMRDGSVLAFGGHSPGDSTTTAVDQIYPDPSLPAAKKCSGGICAFPSLPDPLYLQSAARMPDGSVVLAGGLILNGKKNFASDSVAILSVDQTQIPPPSKPPRLRRLE